MMDVYPNEKYKKIVYDNDSIHIERERLLFALKSIRDRINNEIERKKIEVERELNASQLKRYIK